MDTQQLQALENRMDDIEKKLDDQTKVLHKIEQGIFGDEQLNLPGLLNNYSLLQKQIDELKKEIEELKKVNTKQDTAIQAKKGLTDDAVKWLTRGFWGVAFILALILLVTGKIGIADLINLK